MGLRGLFTADPRLPRVISRFASIAHRPRQGLPAHGILGTIDGAALERAVSAVRADGCYVFEERVDDSLLDELTALAELLPSYASLKPDSHIAKIEFDPAHLLRSRYFCDQADLVNSEIVQRLVADPSLGAVADDYLGCDSVQVDVGMWRSVVFGAETSSASSQMFHSDRDHLQFVKFFVYLTDVISGTGPHVFVRGSHRSRPLPLRRDVRYTDEEVVEYYAPEDIVEICGRRGTIMAVDTSGLHKGKLPETGERWIIELEFASSLFGPGADSSAFRRSRSGGTGAPQPGA